MIKLRYIFFILLFVASVSKTSHSLSPSCYDFLEALTLESKDNPEFRWDVVDEFNDFGISFNYDPPATLDLKDTSFLSKIRRDKRGYPYIGLISHPPYLNYFKKNDILIAIDGKNFNTLDDQTIKELIYSPNKDTINLVYERDKKIKEVSLKRIEYERTYNIVDFALESINDIDIVNSVVTFSSTISLRKEYSDNNIFPVVDLAKKYLVEFKDGKWNSDDCMAIPQDLAEDYRLIYPGENLAFENLLSEDQNLIYDTVDLYFTAEDEELTLNIVGNTTGTWSVRNKFNLLSFPFDRQRIKIHLIDMDDFEENYFEFSDISYRILKLTEENSIPGWKIIDSKISVQNKIDLGNLIFNEGSIEFEIERQSFYYIFKIILPIMLILFVCWSSVWVDRKEIESKLTITIVCLLSLIAYNFVIDNELPKLNYLTVMDWIILTSYVYAAAPNILAIISFQLSKSKNKNKIENLISFYSKRFGILSYFLIVFIIILLNVNAVPENTINALSWAMFKTSY